VIASNDGTASGVVAALAAQGMDGSIPVSGQEAYEGARETATITHRILLRCPRSLRPRPDQRFVIGPRAFAIRAVFDRDGRGRFLTCLVEEGRSEP